MIQLCVRERKRKLVLYVMLDQPSSVRKLTKTCIQSISMSNSTTLIPHVFTHIHESTIQIFNASNLVHELAMLLNGLFDDTYDIIRSMRP